MPPAIQTLRWERPKKVGESVRCLPAVLRLFGILEWAARWFYYGLERFALLRVTLHIVIAASVVAGIVAVASEILARRDERVVRAWDLLLKAKGQGNFGQAAAVQLLNDHGQSLR